MDDKVSDDGLPADDVLGRFTIDERFNFEAPEIASDAAAELPPSRAPGETRPTPPGHEPDATKKGIGSGEDDDPLIGQTVGNYEVLGALGRGGFGTVYKAKDSKLQRLVALKFLRFPLDTQYRKLFSREAQIIANLGKHPSIVQIYTWGEHQGSYYFALEYFDTSAEGLLEQNEGPLKVQKALQIVAECAGALHYAHEQNVLHRDVKPANILIDAKTGSAKMCDFGLAKIQSLGTGDSDTSTIAGSPSYMAPEQIAGQTMDGRTDVYSLGVTLYELLSRKLPCTGSSHLDILDRIRNRKSTPLKEYRPDLSQAVLEIVQRATAYRPEDRFQTAEDMRKAIKKVLGRLESTGSSDSSVQGMTTRALATSKAPRILIAAAAAALLLAVGAFVVVRTGPGQADVRGMWPSAVAEASDKMDDGSYGDAIKQLEAFVAEHPDEDSGHYVLGYANMLMGRFPDAEKSFAKVADESLRAEGLSSVRHAQAGEEARTDLEKAAALNPAGYPALLLASLDILSGDYAAAIARLDKINQAQLYFNWQQVQYHRWLGQAYFKSGQFNGAGNAFALLPQGDAFAQGYLELMKRDETRKDKQARSERIASLTEMWDSMDVADRQDTWTSRPFTLALMPLDNPPTPLAVELGLPDLFSIGLGQAARASREIPLTIVDRESIDAALEELELSSLSSDEGLQVKRIVGARLSIQTTYGGRGDKNWVVAKVMDNETTASVLVTKIDYSRSDDHQSVADRTVEELVRSISENYPLQAFLRAKDGAAVLNIGSTTGVKSNTRFELFLSKGAAPQTSIYAVTTDRIGDSETEVELFGAQVAEIPDEGLYARERRAQ